MNGAVKWLAVLCGTVLGTSCGEPGASDASDAPEEDGSATEDSAGDEVGSRCGNGAVDEGEECDDGNETPRDGCESDCTFTCTGDGECDDGLACTDDVCDAGRHTCGNTVSDAATACRPAAGDCDIAETCDGVGRDCPADEAMAEGDVCGADPRRICRDGSCAASGCGDGWVDAGAGENCEPPGVGSCNGSCRWVCESDADCLDDGAVCNGEEYCDTGAHQCDHRNAPAEGTECQADPRRICIAATCQTGTCGDRYADGVDGEECDDGNDATGDGCEPATCLYSCHADADCGDGEVCNGDETCATTTTHACRPGTDAAPGTACDDGLDCTVIDECDGGGACAGAGNPCVDALACTINEVCTEGTDAYACGFDVDPGSCLIDGVCRADGVESPANPCQSCRPALATGAWSNRDDGVSCGDGLMCRAGSCSLSPCEEGLQCSDGVRSGDESDVDCGGRTCHRCGAGQACSDATDCVSGVCTGALCQPTTLTAISAGGSHTCALTAAGGVMCWGDNASGQLGDGTTTDRTVATAVVGLSSGVVTVAAGWDHTCAVTTAGALKCWGGNASGQLGDGTIVDHPEPTEVPGLAGGVATVAAGRLHSCAVTTAGAVKCWGANGSGRLGDGTNTDRLVPTDVSGLSSGVVAVAAGELHTCILNSSHELRCWGENGSGQLGDNTTTDRWTPVRPFSSYADAFAVGARHTCKLNNTLHEVGCWGEGGDGQLGTGFRSDQDSGVAIVGFRDATALAAGRYHTCALMPGGSVKCAGTNDDGQIGDGSKSHVPVPAPVPALTGGVTAVAAGGWHACAVDDAGAVLCWGRNEYGALGSPASGEGRPTPVVVTGLGSGVAAVAGGLYHTCAVTDAGGVKCWGSNVSGQIGDGTTANAYSPRDVSGLGSGVVALALGELHSCALTSGGGIKCWGGNTSGQLGDGSMTRQLTPVDVSGLTSGVLSITAGNLHTCAVTGTGGAKCWGTNRAYELGDGTNVNRSTPVDVSGLATGVTAIAAGSFHTCALTSAGGVKCWGFNEDGQLGDGTILGRRTPGDVFGLTAGATMVAGGGGHTCALLSGAPPRCWGAGDFGQLGDGTIAGSLTPVDVCDIGPLAMLDAGDSHTCALSAAGGVVCWGSSMYGQLGDPSTGPKLSPVDILL